MTLRPQKIWFLAVLLALCSLSTAQQSFDRIVQQAQQAYQQGNYERATRLYEQALQHKPDYAPAWFYLGMALVKSGKSEDGFAKMEKAVALKPAFNWHFAIGELARKEGETEIAIRHYEACLKFRQDDAVCDNLAALYQQSGNVAKAAYYRSQGVIKEIPKVRRLAFKKQVEIGAKSREELKKFLIHSIDEELPVEKAAAIEAALRVFGFVSGPTDLRQLYIKLLTEQVAGFYDTETKQMYVIDENKEPDFLEQLFGGKQDDSQDRMVMAHEMTHALQDQHFDLEALEKLVKSNDDRTLAMQSLIEGDATLAMLDYQIAPACYTSEHSGVLRMLFSLEKLLVPFLGGKELASVPSLIRESLLFPYVEGLFFCLALRGKDSGYKAIDAAYRKLPASSEQILHPEKYTGNDQPWDFLLSDLSTTLGSDWKQMENNVMGELCIRVLLQEYKIVPADKIAAGWGGDRYSVLKYGENDNLALVWLTTWDTQRDADEFFAAYQKILSHKHDGKSPQVDGHLLTWEKDGLSSRLGIDNRLVYVLEKIPAGRLDEMWQKVMTTQVLAPQTQPNEK